MPRKGVSAIVAIIVLVAILMAGAGGVAVFFQGALENVKDGPDVGFTDALEVVHVSCVGHTMRLTIRNAGDKRIDASQTRLYLYDAGGDFLAVTPERDFSGKRFEQPDGVDTMTFTIPDASPLTDTVQFELGFAEKGVKGGCSPTASHALIGAWSFDTTDRNATHVFDLVGDNPATDIGSPNVGVEGVSGDGVETDGSSSALDVATSDPLYDATSITVMAWARADSGNTGWIVGDGHKFRLRIRPGATADWWARQQSSGSSNQISGGSISAGEWYHVTGTYNSSTGEQRLYVNGELVASATPGWTLDDGDNNQAIGKGYTTSGDWFDGTIDDVRIYNRTLSPQEIRMDAVGLA